MFMIEKADEIRHFYQLTVSAQSRYDLSQNRIIPPNLTNTWNL